MVPNNLRKRYYLNLLTINYTVIYGLILDQSEHFCCLALVGIKIGKIPKITIFQLWLSLTLNTQNGHQEGSTSAPDERQRALKSRHVSSCFVIRRNCYI